jgi:hypothetical protein
MTEIKALSFNFTLSPPAVKTQCLTQYQAFQRLDKKFPHSSQFNVE